MKRISYLAMYVAHLHQEKPHLDEYQYAGQANKDLEFVIDFVKNAGHKSLNNMIKKIDKDLSETPR